MHSIRATIIFVAALLLATSGTAADPQPIEVGSTRQLFVDRFLIHQTDGVSLRLHRPVRREVIIRNEHPWEKYGVSYMVSFRDGNRFRAWYRCDAADFNKGKRHSMTAYAESDDGIHWKKPKLGIIEFGSSTDNNIVWDGAGANMAVFKDGNPAAPPEERYKAIVRDGDVYGLVSPDGLHWHLIEENPLLTDRPFDSHNIAFWDPVKNEYVAYTRGVQSAGTVGHGMSKSFQGGVRGIRRTTSKDFRNWSALKLIDTGSSPLEHLYTNAAVPYDRAPGLYLMFPSRFADLRRPDPLWKHTGVDDIVFLSSRDGIRFARTFMEAFVRPGPDPGNWHDRSLYMERGILETSPTELSLYAMQNWRLDTVHIQRLSLRKDGFVSVNAPYTGGEFVTPSLRFAGNELRLNFSTSAVGSVRVEIQDANAKPISGFSMGECSEIIGDQIDGHVRWQHGTDVSALAGKVVRLRFALLDADLYAFRFQQ